MLACAVRRGYAEVVPDPRGESDARDLPVHGRDAGRSRLRQPGARQHDYRGSHGAVLPRHAGRRNAPAHFRSARRPVSDLIVRFLRLPAPVHVVVLVLILAGETALLALMMS